MTISRYIFLLILVQTFSYGQWETINQPGMGTVSLILAEEDELYAATNQAQVYHSEDQSVTWNLLSDTMDTQPYGADLLFKKDSAVFFCPECWTWTLQLPVCFRHGWLGSLGDTAAPVIGLGQHGGK